MINLNQIFRRLSSLTSPESLSVLITNITLSGRTGTEVVTRDLALGLRRRGHRPIVYTRDASGPIAGELLQASIPVTTEISRLSMPVDIIHGHHTPMAASAICRYPDVPAIFLGHDFIAWHDTAPKFGSLRKICAVDATVAERYSACEGYDPSEVLILPNAVDMERFQPGLPPNREIRRALVFAKNREHLDAIRAACKQRNIPLDEVGAAVGNVISSPETRLAEYDLVFTSALSAMEAMACGRAVIVCDGRGLAGMVTPERMREWRVRNFGLGILTKRLSVENILAEIDRYDPTTLHKITRFIREDADRERWLDRIEDLYRSAITENRNDPRRARAAEIAAHMEAWSPGNGSSQPWLRERQHLAEELTNARTGVEAPQFGETIRFSKEAATSKALVVEGFSWPETWGIWSHADTATVLVRRPRGGNSPAALSIEAQFFLPPQRPTQEVDVLVNGQACATWKLSEGDKGHPRSLTCPLPAQSSAEQLWVTFQIRSPRSPQDCGISNDRRKLGIGLIGLTFEM